MVTECLDLLTRHAQQLLLEENARSGAAPKPVPLHEQAEPAPDVERPLVVAPAMLRDLQRRLGGVAGVGVWGQFG